MILSDLGDYGQEPQHNQRRDAGYEKQDQETYRCTEDWRSRRIGPSRT